MAKDSTAKIIFKGEDQISPAIKGATASVAGLKQGLTTVDTAAKQASDSVRDNLIKQIEAAQQKLKSFASQGLKVEQGKALAELNKLNRELKKLDDPIVIKPKVEFDSLQLNAISQSFGAIAGKLTELRTAAVGAFTEIAKAERKLSTVSDESKQLVKNFGDLAAANKFQTTTAELAGAAYEVISAGFSKTADQTKILDAATKGAVGGFSDVTTVSKATIAALNAYGAGADEAASFVAKFVSVQQNGVITVDQYASQLPKIASIAKLAGVSIDELGGAVASATSNVLPAETAVAGLRTAFSAILKPTTQASEAAEKLGIKFNAASLKSKGLSGLLKDIKDAGGGTAETLFNLFGSQEAAAAIAPLIDNLEKLDENIAKSKNSLPLLADNFEKAVDPIKAFQNQTTEALAVLGRDILQVFNPVISGAKAVVAAFQSLPQELKSIIAFLVGGGAAIATTGAAISGFLAILAPTIAGLKALVTGVTAAFGFLTAGQIALGTATATTTGLTAAEAAAFGGVATASGAAATGVGGLTTATAGLGTAAGITAGTIGLIALAAAPLVIIGKQLTTAFNTAKVVKGLDDIENKIKDLRAKRGKIDNTKITDDGLGGTGINEGNFDGFINPFNDRRSEQEAVIQFNSTESQSRLNKIRNEGVAVLKKYGLASDESAKKTKLNKEQFEAFTKEIEESKEELDNAINGLQQEGSDAKGNPVLQGLLKSRIVEFANTKKLLDERVKSQTETAKKVEEIEKRSSEVIEEIAKKRIDKEKQNNEIRARIRGREFEAQSKTESGNFETKNRDEKRIFEKQLNTEKEAFEKKLNVEKKVFEDSLKTDTKKFTDAQKVDQKSFDKTQKDSDKAYEKEKQSAIRAFDKEQQDRKEAFDKAQRVAALAFDKKQDKEKKTADESFAQRRLDIERKLQLNAAKTPQDRAKLEAEFKATDDKIAKEKIAFAELKTEEEAFAEKQKADKLAFDEAQKTAQKAEEEATKAEKITFDDAQKERDDQRDAQKQIEKDAFETKLNLKKDEFEAAQNLKKEAFELAQNEKKKLLDDAQNVKKQKFEDDERLKKEAFDTQQNLKKQAFEDGERKKKDEFEDGLKAKEAQFKAEERAKDLAAAQQVATIKSNANFASTASNLAGLAVGIASPRAKGGRFNAGQQLLVGEQGQELVTFGGSGFVSNATDTKQILQSNSSAPSSVSTVRMEALLSQLVGKLDRPNIAVQTSENPSDVVVKVQREITRAAAVRSGI